MFELYEEMEEDVRVKVLGIGTAGCKVLEVLELSDIEKVFVNRKSIYSKESENEFSTNLYLVNDDEHNIAGNPNKGYQLAKDNHEIIAKTINDVDIVYVISCLGGSGGGITQYIVEQLRQCNILSIGMLSLPFIFEGDRKNNIAKANYNRLCDVFDSVVLVENDKHLKLLSSNNTSDIFIESNTLFTKLITSMLTLITQPGLINVDLTDMLTVMKNMGACTLGFGKSKGDANGTRAVQAVESAFNSALVNYEGLSSAKGLVVNITAGMDISIDEFEQVGNAIKAIANKSAIVVIGAVINPEYVENIEVTVIASGFQGVLIKPDIEEYNFSEIYRTIEFSTENLNAGLSILSYFEQVLKQKYNDLAATVRIEQNNNSVKLVIQAKDGNVEVIEKALSDYGHVVKGDLRADEILSNPLDIERLNMKLEIAGLELRQNQKIITLYESEVSNSKTRIDNLESQVKMLNDTLCKGLILSQNNLGVNLNQSAEVITSIKALVDEVVKNGLTKEREVLLKDNIELAHKQGFSISAEIDALIKNTIYGVAGNSVFNYLQSLLVALPK
jgi:cell division GTPase FtsZ